MAKQQPREGVFSPNDEHLERRRQSERHEPPTKHLEDTPPHNEDGDFDEEEPPSSVTS